LRVNAVKQLLDRMNAEIEALRKDLASRRDQCAAACRCSRIRIAGPGVLVASSGGKQERGFDFRRSLVVPPHNLRGFLEEMLRRGELKTVKRLLSTRLASAWKPGSPATTAIGLSDWRIYGSGDGSALIDVIQRLGISWASNGNDLQTW